MSLRLNLTLKYAGLLSGVVILLSIVVYSMVSVVMTNRMDANLETAANQIVSGLRVDEAGGLVLDPAVVQVSSTIHYQVWSEDQEILLSSQNAQGLEAALDSTSLGVTGPVFKESDLQEEPFRVLTVPLTVGGQAYGWLQVGCSLAELRHTQWLLRVVFGGTAIFAIIVSGLIGWVITRQALEPLATVSQVARQIMITDDLSLRIPVTPGRTDEIGELVLSFNQTLVRLERLFNAQRRFLADVSHELRTPLTVIKGNIGLMRMLREVDDESMASIESEVDRLTRLVGDLLLMAQAETGRMPLMLEQVEIDELVFEVFEQLKVLSAGAHDIQGENIEPAMVTGDRDRLKQVLLNLGSNAIKYTSPGEQILLNQSVSGNWVQIDVIDHGLGIEEEELSHIFERFYRGDKSRSRAQKDVGFGLGLPIAYWIVRNHGGRIDVASEVGRGTVFTVWLPISQAEIPTRPIHTAPPLV